MPKGCVNPVPLWRPAPACYSCGCLLWILVIALALSVWGCA